MSVAGEMFVAGYDSYMSCHYSIWLCQLLHVCNWM